MLTIPEKSHYYTKKGVTKNEENCKKIPFAYFSGIGVVYPVRFPGERGDDTMPGMRKFRQLYWLGQCGRLELALLST